jgi:hypothetical protein
MQFSKSKRITFYRGDDDALMVALADGAIFVAGDKVFFSLKATEDATVDLLQIESTTFVSYNNVEDSAALITIPHDSTIELDLGNYYYDILIKWADGTYVTIVPPTRFKLEAGGSHEPVSIPM